MTFKVYGGPVAFLVKDETGRMPGKREIAAALAARDLRGVTGQRG